jgi:molybdate transport system substrate-binding protein
MSFFFRLLTWAACGLTSVSPALAASINVLAAASLTDCLKEVAASYSAKTGDSVKVVFVFGASSLLARQIEEGAPVDLFISADEAKMDRLEKAGLIVKETRRSRLSNALAVVVAADSLLQISSPRDLADSRIKRIALADPKAVPAGIYSQAYLEKLGLWTAIAPKVVPTDNVRAALAAVESGNVEAGMVYRTDAAISKRVKVAYEVPVKEGPVISYPMAVVKGSRHPEISKRLLDYLGSDAATRVFEKYGFILLPSANRQP